jgi:hypothetical protein
MSEPINDDYRVEELTDAGIAELEQAKHVEPTCGDNIYTGTATESDLSLEEEG